MYETTYYTTSSNLSDASVAAGGILAFSMIAIAISFVVMIAAYLFGCFLLSRIFKKAGVKASVAYIPIYNSWKFLELGDQKGFWIFVPVANAIFQIIAAYNIGKKLGKEDWFIALYILVPIIWIIMLAFDKSVWNGGMNSAPAPVAATPEYQAPEPNPVSLNTETPTVSAPEPAQVEEPVATAPEQPTEAPAETAETDTASVDSDNTEA